MTNSMITLLKVLLFVPVQLGMKKVEKITNISFEFGKIN